MVKISGDQGYTPYRPGNLTFDVDAAGATFRMNQKTNAYPFNVEKGTPGHTVLGGTVLGEVQIGQDWEPAYKVGNSAALRFEACPSVTVKGWKFTNCWDALRFGTGSDGFIVDGVWVDGSRDDAIENDKINSGLVRNCLFEAFVAGMSTDGDDIAGKRVVFEGVLIHSRAFLYKGKVTHQSPFKTNKDKATSNPLFTMRNTVIAIEVPGHEGYERLAMAFSRMDNVSGCYFLNLSDTSLPSSYPKIPAGFTVLQGAAARAFWEGKRAAWVAAFLGETQTPPLPKPEPEPQPEPKPQPEPQPEPQPQPDPTPTPEEPTFEALLAAISGAVDELKQRFTSIEAAVATNTTAIAEIQAPDLGPIQAELARLDARLDAISGAAAD